MKNKKSTVLISNNNKKKKKKTERDKIDTSNTHIHDCSLSWLNTICTSVKSGGIKASFMDLSLHF